MEFDKYLMISLISTILLISFAVGYSNNEEVDNTILGLVTDVSQSPSGFLVDLSDENGKEYHCFTKTSVDIGMICYFSGNYSSDNSIFFITALEECKL